MTGPETAALDRVPATLPGADLVAAGIEALRRGETTEEALLVLIGAWRLRAAGLDVPAAPDLETSPEIALYGMIAARRSADAHSRYNALVRRLVSFERALESRPSAGASFRPPSAAAGEDAGAPSVRPRSPRDSAA